VNAHPDVLNQAIGVGEITWCSPLVADDYAEYRDSAFLERVSCPPLRVPLSEFWPAMGPQWDALGRASSGDLVLVEAKANLPELMSSPSEAGATSAARINAALQETAKALGSIPGTDWSKRFYQYANRLAHSYFLNERNEQRTKLVFLYFIGDSDTDGPHTRREWEAAISVLQEALGIRGRMPSYVIDAFVDVRGKQPVVAN
jgi:hypothetical protein